MPGKIHEMNVKWLERKFDRVICNNCFIPLKYCPHKPKNTYGCRPDVLGIYKKNKLAVGEVNCKTAKGPCEYVIIDTKTRRILEKGKCPY